jgi:excinuclease ABC subunit B
MSSIKLESPLKPTGDQPKAIKELTQGLINGSKFQTLLGATGTGKTFTIANVISNVGKKTLVMAHNKTLAGQLYMELKDLFPNNRVEYFISYFDFYQPEAYIPRSDTYIEKSAKTNQEIEMMRLSTFNSLTTSQDVIVVASVAAIYGAANPKEFEKFKIIFKVGQNVVIKDLQDMLVKLNYKRNNIDLSPGSYRLKGDTLEIAPGWTSEYIIRISFFGNEIEEIKLLDVLTSNTLSKLPIIAIYPADEYVIDNNKFSTSLDRIKKELELTVNNFKRENKLIEAQRIEQRTIQDIESLKEFGRCPGIENYSRHLELRNEGETPYTLLDYFGDDWLLVMDESHMSVPQIRGMYNTDRSRKQTLVDFGFRLPSAMDNRPLNFEEYCSKIKNVIFVSATPNEYEINLSQKHVVEQIVRPTGLLDPIVEIRKSEGQIDDIIVELKNQIKKNQRMLIVTLTIRMAEEITNYLKQKNFKVAYIHNELKTLQRGKVLNDLRRGKYDAIVGINLLREGIDLPEVSLVAILDADKEGFLRNDKSLIQIIGRAARNIDGRVIMYADKITESITTAMKETDRRRKIQEEHNRKNNITPKTIIKDIRDDIKGHELGTEVEEYLKDKKGKKTTRAKAQVIARLKQQMMQAAKNQEYERAAEIRDMIIEVEEDSDERVN